MIKKISIKTKFGWLTAFENKEKIFRIKYGKEKKQSRSRTLISFKRNVHEFFCKKTKNIKIPHKIVGSKIQKKVWRELKNIRPGCTKTYGSIAKKFKLSPRHVGKICGQNKLLLLIPCHRVIKTDGSLGGFSSLGGVNLKKKLLEFENSWK